MPAVGDQGELGAREELLHLARERGELLVARAGDEPDRRAQLVQLVPVARLSARSEMAQGAGQACGTVCQPLGPELLTPREADVLEHLQAGRSNAEIALALSVSVETVRTHRRNIYRKLGVRTRRELASLSHA